MLVLTVLWGLLASAQPMIMRNNALMTKMVSQFQGKESRPRSEEPKQENYPLLEDEKPEEDSSPTHVLSVMQNVLCKNFPSVPCDLITKDETLRSLIEKSIQQLKYKKITMERTTVPPSYQLTLFPVITGEDLSNFLQVSNTGVFKQKKTRKKPKNSEVERHWEHVRKNKPKSAVISGRKKMRKFYPHKYKDKGEKNYHEYSEEKLSISVETDLDQSPNMKRSHFSYRGEPSDPPVWRIDYMKHGEPSMTFESDTLKEKLIKTAPGAPVDEHRLARGARRDVLHPDVYIKKNFKPKSSKDNSEALD